MQIRLRPSGGRGEYELAGSHGSVRGSDLYGHNLLIDFGLTLRIPLFATADTHDGKPRIRLIDQRVHVHAARLIAAVLLLPEPIREIRKTPDTADVDLSHCAYSAITVDVVTKNLSDATLRPRTIVAINSAGSSLGIDVLNRFELVQRLWGAGSNAATLIDIALCEHREACFAQPFIHKNVLSAAKKVIELLPTANQILIDILHDTDENAVFSPQTVAPTEDDLSNPIQVNREIRKRLVWRAERGAEGRRFQRSVNAAYDFKCAFTGLRLPPLVSGYLPGVDAAHIFPWSQQGSNDVTNGICLNKQMHWAFDEGILKLTFEKSLSIYRINLGDDVSQLAIAAKFDLAPFTAVCGQIPEINLPTNPAQRPSARALDLYNALMFPLL